MTPQSARINLQSPQSDSTPWSLTLGPPHVGRSNIVVLSIYKEGHGLCKKLYVSLFSLSSISIFLTIWTTVSLVIWTLVTNTADLNSSQVANCYMKISWFWNFETAFRNSMYCLERDWVAPCEELKRVGGAEHLFSYGYTTVQRER